MLSRFQVPGTTHILLGICTFERPKMLMRCLSSVRRLVPPAGCKLSVVVVDNERRPACCDFVSSMSSEEAGPFHYVHEPARGIAQARNAILNKAADLNAGWVAMIDDDQLVPRDWLQAMWRAQADYGADIVYNAVRDLLPDPLPLWAFPKSPRTKWKVGAAGGATNGVLFNTQIKDEFGVPLRFDETYGITGGEDRDFYQRAVHNNALVVWTPDAVSHEDVPPSKLTFRAQVWRAYWIAVVNARQDRSYYGWAAYPAKTVTLAGALVNATAMFAFAPLAGFAGSRSARKRILKGAKYLAKAAGILVGLGGFRTPEPYRTIHGI